MKNNRGITLISLTVYIIILLFAIGMISTFSRYFYHNVKGIVTEDSSDEQFTNFTSYLTSNLINTEFANVKEQDNNTYLCLTSYNRK